MRKSLLLPTCLLFLCSCTGWYNMTGANQKKAIKEATEWAEKKNPEFKVDCPKKDSDNDGFVTCTVFFSDKEHKCADTQQTLECADKEFFGFAANEGCKPTERITGRF